jgi:phosphate transporter
MAKTPGCQRRMLPSELSDLQSLYKLIARYIFSQMFSPTIMLLIGGFTIAAVLSKTRLDVMTASRILNAAGEKPSVILLVLMCVATFASMWISNVAAPTLCYALIKVSSIVC